jgi:hypothetical protein
MSEWYTAVPSHNAGSTAVTAVSSLLLATFYATSGRNQGKLQNQLALTAEPNLHVQLHETATWRTKSVSNGGTRSQSELAESLGIHWSTGVLLEAFFGASWGSKLETFVWMIFSSRVVQKHTLARFEEQTLYPSF